MILKRLFLYFNTIRYLRFKQLVYNLIRRVIQSPLSTTCIVESRSLSLDFGIKYSNKINGQTVCFLNDRVNIDQIKDWQCQHKPKLWRYNLHYFDFLLDDGADQNAKDDLINGWIRLSQQLKEDAWEPYVVSLRIVNWIKYFIHYKNNDVPDAWLGSLHQQADVLSRSIEYHILANHYLKNGKGLFFAGAYLKSERSVEWYLRGEKILIEQAREQILPDGGHYEKSPMYHCIVVEDYLDVINLIKSNRLDFKKSNLIFLEDKTKCALDFLHKILMPDGNIPLFNDSAFSIAPTPDAIFEYAKHVTGYDSAKLIREDCISLKDSGYYCITDGNHKLIIDCGSISPDYQPGHTHCDLLSYELAINGKRVIVDTGLYDYEKSEARLYCRSTRAHNTICIDDKEQSEVWGQFRVARRASVITASLTRNASSGYVFMGCYSPFWGDKDNIVHKRVISYSDNVWNFTDEVIGKARHKVTGYIHLHPDLNVRQDGCYCYLVYSGVEFARIVFDNNYRVSYGEGHYYPEFGLKYSNIVISMFNESSLPLSQHYSIETISDL